MSAYNGTYYCGHYVIKKINETKSLFYSYECIGDYDNGYHKRKTIYKVIEINYINSVYNSNSILYTSSSPSSTSSLPYSYGNIFATIIDDDNTYKFLKYGVKTQAGSYITKAGFTDYENPSTYDTYNN